MKEQRNKFQQWKQAMRNAPPERLLRMNMQGYVLQTIGMLIASVILIYKGIWYIVLAFIFSLWNNTSGFIGTYQQYKNIIELKAELNLPTPEDKSPHRRKVKLIKKHFGWFGGWIAAILSVIISYSVFHSIEHWYLKYPAMFLLLIVIYYLTYFVFFYYIAKQQENKNAS